MNRLWDLVREPVRRLLMRILILTEKRPEQKAATREKSVLTRDIHIPPILVAAFSAAFLLAVLVFQTGFSLPAFLSLSAFVLLILSMFVFYLRHDFPKLIHDDEAMMLLGTLVVVFVSLIVALKSWRVSSLMTPVAAASILSTLLLHPRLSLVLTMILSIVFGMLHNYSFELFTFCFFGGAAGTAAAVYIRTHRDFIRTGLVIGLVQVFVFAMLALFRGATGGEILWGSLRALLNGFISAVLALGLLPFLESFFLRVTPMKLMELADFNQPLLKRLMVEAPGTYHHSLMMATVAEAAASAIGANPLLCRVGAYYHDIGKLVKPEYFIENQGNLGGQNPHGNLAPALSSLVVISHIKEGIALARAAKLPQEIINFIPMHHGTSRIEYFYHQAKEDAEEEMLKHNEDPDEAEVGEENYRYPGPRPETKETAILMLADSVEAAARTLEEPTHQRIRDLVGKLVRKKLEDGQLNNAPLTLADVYRVQESFAKTLTSVYHSRIEYPEEEEERK